MTLLHALIQVLTRKFGDDDVHLVAILRDLTDRYVNIASGQRRQRQAEKALGATYVTALPAEERRRTFSMRRLGRC